jgi:hypothetical protein
VIKIEIDLSITVDGGVRRSEKGSMQLWCGFNASISAREGEATG